MVAARDFNLIPLSFAAKILPHDMEAERRVLATCLFSPDALIKASQILCADAFYTEYYRIIYRAMLKMQKRQTTVNAMTLVDQLSSSKALGQVGVKMVISQLLEELTPEVYFSSALEIVHKYYVQRQIIELGEEIAARGTENYDIPDLLELVEKKTLALTKGCSSVVKADRDKREYEGLLAALRDIEMRESNPGLKVFRLQKLAKEYGRQFRELEHIYLKSLCAKAGGPLKTLDDLDDECQSETREWLIHGLLPVGTVLEVHAMGGVGKTKLLYDLMFNLVIGSPWNGFPVTSSERKVLVYQDDESPHDMRQALRKRGFFDNPETKERFKYRRGFTMDNIPLLVNDLDEFDPDIIVIDSLTTANRYSIFSENDTEYARPLLELTQIAADRNKTIVVIHHSNGEGGSRGTKAIFNSVSEVWCLKRDTSEGANEQEKILTIEKSRSRRFPCSYRLFFNEDDFSFSCMGELKEDQADVVRTKDRIVKFLLAHPNTRYEAEEIQYEVGNTLGHIRRCLNRLEADGMISAIEKQRNNSNRTKYKVYFITYTGETEAPPNTPQTGEGLDTGSASDQHPDQHQKSLHIKDSGDADPTPPKNPEKISEKKSDKKSTLPDQHQNLNLQNPPQLMVFDADPDADPVSSSLLPLCGQNPDHVGVIDADPVTLSDADPDADPQSKTEVKPEEVNTSLQTRICPNSGIKLPQPVEMTISTPLGEVAVIATMMSVEKGGKYAAKYEFHLPTGKTIAKNVTVGNREQVRLMADQLTEKWWRKEVATKKSYRYEVQKMEEDGYTWVKGCKCVEIPKLPIKTWYVFETPRGDHIRVSGEEEFRLM